MPSLEAPQLKPLLGNLEYSFLADTPPKIITSAQEDKLTIGWTLTDLKEANLSVCMHYKAEAKPHRNMQRIVNLNMRKVSKEPIEPKTTNETDKLKQNNLIHKLSLTLKHIEEQDLTSHKMFQGNIRKFKPTIKGSSYFPT